MKGDLELIRCVLLAVEQAEYYEFECADLADSNHDERTSARRVGLLGKTGYLEANLFEMQSTVSDLKLV